MLVNDDLKTLIYKLKKQELIEVFEAFIFNVEEYQEQTRQHLVDRQKLIFYKDQEIARQDREINWQRDKLRERTKKVFALEEKIRRLKEDQPTQH